MRVVDFKRLNLRLLKGGVAPKYAQRTILELSSHLEDLVNQEKSNGASDTEANATALGLLGDEDSLVKEALAKKEIQSWSRRYTKSFYLVVPLLAYFILMLCLFAIGLAVVPEFSLPGEPGRWQGLLVWSIKGFIYFVEYLITPLIALAMAYIAVRRNVPMFWPIVGVLVLSFFGSGIDTYVREPEIGGHAGGVNLFWGWTFLPWEYVIPRWDQTFEQLARVTVTIFMVVMLFRRYKPYELDRS